MTNRYSPSRINTFDECKLEYKYKYVDGLISDLETVERFMKNRVRNVFPTDFE